MKSLHKKIGVVALSSALVMGGAFAGASHMRDLPSKGLVAEAAPRKKQPQIKVPFLLASELKAHPEKAAENDRNILYGVSEMYNYIIYKVGKSSERYVKDLGVFEDGNGFLNHLVNNSIEEGQYNVKIGRQEFVLQFNDYSSRGNMWWLKLDQWQYGAEEYFKGIAR